MGGRGGTVEGPRRLRGWTLTTLALCAALTLTACNGEDGGTDAAGTPSGASPAGPSTSPTGATPPAGTPTPPAGAGPSASAVSAKPTAPATAKATPAGKPKSPAPACDHKMPISPDEIAVNRYTPEGGFHSLIVKHGNWGCGAPDSDGAPFETVGKETFIPIRDDAKITAVTPIVESTENEPITLDALIEWLVAHPNQGLVFRYHLGGKGAIDTLDQVFTP
ncbi:hypothetical protein ABT246_18565 [Streptomyces sp. NPDC001553]|uniref:hypothetical protein n=1 Tax=Streptomyces sp. NPDC001553 TaxID=3154385 RepID=UPI003320D868